jgi:hypothetical protein
MLIESLKGYRKKGKKWLKMKKKIMLLISVKIVSL